jgi:uncharacterized damage-inducible protein DinB
VDEICSNQKGEEMRILLLANFALVFAGGLRAQNPLAADSKFGYTIIKQFVARAAEKMPEADYSFKPAPTVRTFGQIIGHIADDNYYFCSTVKGESKDSNIEKTVTPKADLIAQLKQAFAYCDAVYNGFQDSQTTEKVKAFGGERTKLFMLDFNFAHMYEHYGNIATYMRIKGLVPPSSEQSK